MGEIALVSLALAFALKVTPAVLGVLLLYKKQWKKAIRVVCYGVVVGIMPFLFFEGGLANIPQMISNMQENLGKYTSSEGGTIYASVLNYLQTLSGEYTFMSNVFGESGIPYDKLDLCMRILTYVVCASFLFWAPMYKKRWEQLMAISMVLLIFPSHSGYYCILYLIPAMIAFLNEEEHQKIDLIVLMAILFIMIAVQSDLGRAVMNYHTSILVLCGFLFVRGAKNMIHVNRDRRLK